MPATRVAGGRRAGRMCWPLRGSGCPAVTLAVRCGARADPRVRMALEVKAAFDCIDSVG